MLAQLEAERLSLALAVQRQASVVAISRAPSGTNSLGPR
jgi:hypothetical protein